MSVFFDRIRELLGNDLTSRQASDKLNEIELEIFTALPWALELPEREQNELIEFYVYKTRRTN